MMRHLAFIVLLFWVQNSQASELAAVYKLPAYLQQVTTLGEWSHKGEVGVLRLAITLKEGEYKAFLQWLLRGEVISTVSIKEVNQGSRYVMTSPVYTRKENKSLLFLDLRERQRNNHYKAKIEITGIGYYRCDFLPSGVVVDTD